LHGEVMHPEECKTRYRQVFDLEFACRLAPSRITAQLQA